MATDKSRVDVTLSLPEETFSALEKQAAKEKLPVQVLIQRIWNAVGIKARELNSVKEP